MKHFCKKLLAFSLAACLMGLLCIAPVQANDMEPQWSQSLGDGAFTLVRIVCPQGKDMRWGEQRYLFARYVSTGEIVPISGYYDNAVYAVVPTARAKEAFRCEPVGAPTRFQDMILTWNGTDYYDPPTGTDDLAARGILRGNEKGELLPDQAITRAEAFAFLIRTLGIESSADPGYADVNPNDWYYGIACAARAYGLAAQDVGFNPTRIVTRAEFCTMLYRAFRLLGWASPQDTALDFADQGEIQSWARDAYLSGFVIQTDISEETGEFDPSDGAPVERHTYYAEPGKAATRAEVVQLLSSSIFSRPVYPSMAAIDSGFDRAMPVIDGSTSTYPYTQSLYTALFHNYYNHPGYVAQHSKSHQSYERLISGEVDALFAATAPSEELKAQAKAAGVELELIPIAYDAMVFFTNEENSATDLTRAQLQDIYVRSAYSNWSQVGGPSAVLLPYCRNTTSGSHALMEQYFLDGGTLSLSDNILQGNVSQAMSSALTDVAAALDTETPAYALGYSVYYYYLTAQAMMGDVTSNQLKLLAVDGVLPSDETIASGAYPLAGHNYLVLRADTPQDAPARKLAAFMLSPVGQSCVENAGFGPISPVSE